MTPSIRSTLLANPFWGFSLCRMSAIIRPLLKRKLAPVTTTLPIATHGYNSNQFDARVDHRLIRNCRASQDTPSRT